MDYSNMTLREKILQTFVVTIREINRFGGPEEFFEKYPVGGMYFGLCESYPEGFIEDGSGTTREKLERCIAASKGKLMVCADGVPMVGQKDRCPVYKSLGSSKNMDDAYELGKLYAMAMNANHVDWMLWPIVDLYYDSAMPLYAVSDDAQLTADITCNIIKGLQDNGICATAKHFPGLGSSNINMHFGNGKNILDFDEWMDTYGLIYKQAIDSGVMCIMNTHATLRSYANEDENGFVPIATYSSKLTTELLKEKLGFKGAVVTDALIMGGMSTGNLVDETVQAFKAGADLLLWPPMAAADKIEELILSGEIPMSRLDDALERIGRMRDYREKAIKENMCPAPDVAYHDASYAKICEHGICEYKNEIGLLPLDVNKYKKILIVDATENEEMDPNSSYVLKNALEKYGFECEVRTDIYDIPSCVCWQEDIDAIQNQYDLTIFNLNMDYTTAWKPTYMYIWASQMFDKSRKIIINHGAPMFADIYFPREHTIVETNNYMPIPDFIEVLAEGLVGKRKFTGTKVLTGKIKM